MGAKAHLGPNEVPSLDTVSTHPPTVGAGVMVRWWPTELGDGPWSAKLKVGSWSAELEDEDDLWPAELDVRSWSTSRKKGGWRRLAKVSIGKATGQGQHRRRWVGRVGFGLGVVRERLYTF